MAALASAATVLVTGCGSSNNGTTAADSAGGGSGTTTLKIADFPVMELGALFLGRDEGDFTKQGVTLKSVQLSGAGAAMLPALQSGAIDIAPSNVVSVMQANAQGQDVKCFAAITRRPATGRPLAIIASPKANVSSAKDLVGKTVAVNALGGSNDLITREWLQSQGVDPKSVKLVATAVNEMPQVLSSGSVAAAIVDEPYTTIAVDDGDKVLAERPYQAIAPTPIFSCWAATSKTIQNNSKALKAFVAGMDAASKAANGNRSLVSKTLVSDMKMDQKVADAATVPQFVTAISADDLKVWADAAEKFGLLKSGYNPANAVATVGN
jgi:NitT/TauT family transport system substrate-binding protein